MRKLALSALLPLSLLAAAACDTPGGLDFNFAATGLPQTPDPIPSDSLFNPVGGVLYLIRSTTTPCYADGLTGDGDRNGSRLTLTVTRIPASPCTNEEDRFFRYRATFGNLSTGTYQVRIVEEIEGAPRVVQDTSIVVD